MPANGRWDLTRRLSLILLTWRIWWAPNNASRWQMGFNSAFKWLICPPLRQLYALKCWTVCSAGMPKFRATKYFTMTTDIFRMLNAVSFPCMQKCVIILRWRSRKCQVTQKFNGHSRTVSSLHGTSFLSPYWCLEFGGVPWLFGKLANPRSYHAATWRRVSHPVLYDAQAVCGVYNSVLM